MARETLQSKTLLPTPPNPLAPSTIWITEIEPPEARHGLLRGTLAALAAMVALAAIPGAIFVVPTLPRTWLHQGLIAPFADFAVPALTLGVLCGGGAVLTFVTVLRRPRIGALVALVAGTMMVGFELVEILVVGFTPVLYPTQLASWFQIVYLVVGAAMAVLGEILWIVDQNTVQHGE